MKKQATKLEMEKRIMTVMGWIIEDVSYPLMVSQIVNNGWCGDRQARNIIKTARERWLEEPVKDLHNKRALKIKELQARKRTLLEKYKGSPSGIFALNQIDKMIIDLEGLDSPKVVEVAPRGVTPEELRTLTDALNSDD